MTTDNQEIVRLLGMGMTWEAIQREAEQKGLKYDRPSCADRGRNLSIGEVVRDARYCYLCEEKDPKEQARGEGEASEDQAIVSERHAETALHGLAMFGRVLPVPWLIGGAVLIAAGFALAREYQRKRSR